MAGLTRSQTVAQAVQAEVARRRAALDADEALVSVTIVVKLDAATGRLRGTSWQEERLARDLLRRPGG